MSESMGEYVGQKLIELEKRISVTERNALAFVTQSDNFVKRYAEVLILGFSIVGFLVGHFWR